MSDITVAMPDGNVISFPANTDKDTINRVAHDYASKSTTSASTKPQVKPKATPPAPAPPTRQQIDNYRLSFFNTDNPKANVPKQTATALAANPNDPQVLATLSKMSPVGQAAIREHAGEIKAENDRTQAYIHSFDGGASPQAVAESLHSIAGGGGFVNPVQVQAYKAQDVPGFDPSAAFKGPEGARQGKMAGHGKLDPSLNVLADFAAFGATPEGAAFGESMGVIGSLGKGAAKAVTAGATLMGEADAVNRYRKGDKQGAATSAVLGLVPIGIHAISGKIAARRGESNVPDVPAVQLGSQAGVVRTPEATEAATVPGVVEPAVPETPSVRAPASNESGTIRPSSVGILPEQVKSLARDGFTKAADLYAAAKKTEPNLTKEEFAQQLYEFHKAHADDGGTHNYEGGSGDVKAKDIFIAKNAAGEPIRYYGFSEKTTASTDGGAFTSPTPEEIKLNEAAGGVTNREVRKVQAGLPISSFTDTELDDLLRYADVNTRMRIDGLIEGDLESHAILRKEVADEINKRGGNTHASDRQPGSKNPRDFSIDPQKSESPRGDSASNSTKLANEHVNAQRAIYELEPTTPAERQSQQETTQRVLSQGLHEDAVRVAQEVLKDPRPMTTDELAANALKQHQLKDTLNGLQDQIRERVKSGVPTDDLQQQHDQMREDYKTLTDASARTGTEQGRGLAFRKHVIDDFSHANIMDQLEMANPHTPLSEEEKGFADKTAADIQENDADIKAREEAAPDREEAESQDAYEKTHEELKPKKVKPARTPEGRAKQKADILTDREEIKRRFIKNVSKLSAGFDPTVLKDIRDLAASHAKEGILNAQDMLDEVHKFVSEHVEGATKREVRDAISGYGYPSAIPRETRMADFKAQYRLISEIEDAKNKVAKQPRQKIPVSSEVEALRKEKSEALAANRPVKPKRTFQFKPPTPEQRLASYQKAVQNRITDLSERIANRDFSQRERNPIPLDDHTRELIRQRDELQSVFSDMKASEPGSRLDDLTRRFEKRKVANAAGDYGKARTEPRPDTPEEAAMRSNLSAADNERGQMRKASGLDPAKDPYTSAKTRLQSEIGELEREIETGKPERISNMQPRKLDAEGEALKERRANLRNDVRKAAEARRPKTFADKVVGWRRFAALSHFTSIGKLGVAALKRTFLSSPAESLAGAVTRRLPVLSRIAEKAPEGTPTWKGQMEAWNSLREKKTYESTFQKMKTGLNHLDLMYGDKKHTEEDSLASWVGRLHGMEKTPTQIGEFNKSYTNQEEFYKRKGYDTSNPAVQSMIAARAYVASREAILMQDNGLSSAFYDAVQGLERSKNPLSKTLATGAKLAVPIVKVPANYVGEALLKTPVVGLGRLSPLMGRSVESLTPAEADLVMKVFRKQGVGMAMALTGYLGYKAVGGNYLPGKRATRGETPQGEYAIGPVKISKFATHSADDAVVMMFADLHRAMDHDAARGENLMDQLWSGAHAAAVGTAGDIPFFDVMQNLVRAQESSDAAGSFAGRELTSMTVPGVLPDVGTRLDRDDQGNVRKRKVRGFTDAVKQGVGLQVLLPEKR